MVHFTCACGMQIAAESAGHKITCPGCGKVAVVQAAVPAAVIDQETAALSSPVSPEAADEYSTDPGTCDRNATVAPGGLALGRDTTAARDAGLSWSLGGYRILRELGHGGMGTVYEAEDIKLERHVALKVMKPEIAQNEQHRERFLREACTAASVVSDFICPIYEVGEDNGVPFIAMPFLKGEPLNAHWKKGTRLAIDEVVRIGKQVADGLSAAHEAGLVHRDIKPGNIWLETQLTGPPRALILDFGLARVQADNVHITQSGAIVGTPAYMSPEQARGDKNVDARTDLFSLGCVLYALCTGELPFQGATMMDVLMALGTHDPAPPHTLSATIPQPLSDLILRLLAKNADDRPRTARDVIEELAAIERDLAQPATEIPTQRIKPPTKSGSKTLRIPDADKTANGTQEMSSVAAHSALGRKTSYALFTLIAIGLLSCVIPLVGGGVYYIVTDNGTIELQTEDKNVQVLLLKNGQEIEILDGASEKTWSVRPGTYTLRLQDDADDLEIVMPDTFELKRGGKHVVTIRKLPPDPRLAWVHNNLGNALRDKGQLDEAIAEYRKAIAIGPKQAMPQNNLLNNAHYNVGFALCKLGKLDEARATFQEACPDPGLAQAFFANALRRAGKMAEGVAAAREGVRLNPGSEWTHWNLGWALQGQRDWDGSIAAYREAIRLKPNTSDTVYDLAYSLEQKGLLDEAIAEYRKAIQLAPWYADAHNNLGWVLYRKGKTDDAITSYREAIACDPKHVRAHNNLGDALKDKGELEQAIASYRKADELDPKASWAHTRAATAQRLAAARDKFPAFQDGSYTPATTEERLVLVEWCQYKKLHHTAAGLYATAFIADPKLADDLKAAHRYNAACAAALAAAGQGEEAARLDDNERARLRKQALDWLGADLVLRRNQLESGQPADRATVKSKLRYWQRDAQLAGIREKAVLDKLPADEQKPFTRFWSDVAALLKKAEEQPK